MKLRTNLLLAASVLALSTSGLRAATFIPTFTGQGGIAPNTVSDQWTAFDRTNHPDYPATTSGSQVWPAALGPDTVYNTVTPTNPRGVTFQKLDLNSSETTDFLGATDGGGIYNFFSTTNYKIDSTNPVDGLSALNLESSIAGAFLVNPTLTLHTTLGDVSNLSASVAGGTLLSQTPVTLFGMPTNYDLRSFTWDLSGISGEITGFEINWQMTQHAVTAGFQLTQGTAEAVPEPSTWALMGFAGVGFVLLAKRRMAKAQS